MGGEGKRGMMKMFKKKKKHWGEEGKPDSLFNVRTSTAAGGKRKERLGAYGKKRGARE